MNIVTTDPLDRVLRVTAAICIVFGVIALTDYFSLFRAIDVMCAAISPLVCAYGYFFRNPWATRAGVSLLVTGVIFYFINADMGWHERYCILSPLGC